MTIQIPYRGIIEIVADHDIGKTIAALQVSNQTKDIVFVDDDVKGEGTVRQMKENGMEFDDYIDLAQERVKLGDTPVPDELLKVVKQTIERIKSKKRKVIIWDTWRIVYQAARGHVERHQNEYSKVVTFRGNSQIIQGLISKVARMIEVKQLNELKSVCELLVITHHLKDNYVNNVAVGKIPESSATFSEVCNMRLWLRRNPISKVPIILFLKRPNVPVLKGGQLRFVNIVPLKITPTDKHNSIWDAIKVYQDNPIESRQPTVEETPTAEELAAISGTLTQEQQSYIKMMIEYNKEIEKDLAEASQDEELFKEPVTKTMLMKTVSDYPSNGVIMISRASAELGLNGEKVSEILGKPIAEVINTYKPEYWDTLKGSKDNAIKDKGKKK